MSTVAEIEAAIAQLPPSQWTEIRRWMDAHAPKTATMGFAAAEPANTPDFLVRQKAVSGDRVLPDSQTVLDDLRAERV